MGGEQAAAVYAEGVDGDPVSGRVGVDLQLHPLTGPHLPGRHRIQAGLEGHQAVLADPPQMFLRDHTRMLRQRFQRRPIGPRHGLR
jgi:hypothetical protein